MTQPSTRVVIIGGGATPWMAATALKRAFPRRAIDVCVIETPADDAPLAFSSLSPLRAFHTLIGIDENELIRRTGATFKLAVEHCDWDGEGSRAIHPFGETGLTVNATPFHQFWLRQARAGRVLPLEDYSLGASAALAGKFARPTNDPRSILSSYTYGYHLAAGAYCDFLRDHARQLGVESRAGALADISFRLDGAIETIQLANGEKIDGALFIDCTGDAAKLIGRMGQYDFIDWSHWLPCDRIVEGFHEAREAASPLSQTRAVNEGWAWRYPLQSRASVGLVYGSRFLSDDAALTKLAQAWDSAAIASPHRRQIRQGRRQTFWRKNCVAIGAAAGCIEPLAGAETHLVQAAIANLVSMFPLDMNRQIEAGEYNRVMGEIFDGVRDLTVAQYRLSQRGGGAFWDAARAQSPPSRLSDKLDLYAVRGQIAVLDHETFEQADWAALFIGHRWIAGDAEYRTHLASAELLAERHASLASAIRDALAKMPSLDEYLDRHGLGNAAAQRPAAQ